jgi:hypothetical protein
MIIKLRRDSATDWNLEDPVLAEGEPGWDMTANTIRLGNGTDVWSDLIPLTSPTVWGDITGSLAAQTDLDSALAGKAATGHTHTGVYEPADATILKDADIGVTVASQSHNHTGVYEPADATILKDADIGVTIAAATHVHLPAYTAVTYTTPTLTLAFTQNAVYSTTATSTPTTWAVPSGLPSAGSVASWTVELTNGGLSTQTFTNARWDGGTEPVLTVTGTDILTFYTRDGGTTIRGFLAAADSKP